MNMRTVLGAISLAALVAGCQSKPGVVVDVARSGEGSDRIVVVFDRSGLHPADSVYFAQENLGPGRDRLTVVPEASAMVRGDIQVRVIVESRSPAATQPTLR